MGRVEKYDDIPVFEGHERERGPTKMLLRKAEKQMQTTQCWSVKRVGRDDVCAKHISGRQVTSMR